MKRRSLLFYFGLLALFTVVSLSVWKGYREGKLEESLAVLQSREARLQAEVLVYNEQSAGLALTAKETIDQLRENALLWSEVIRDIRDVARGPSGRDVVQILSYSGGDSGAISLSLRTHDDSLDPYLDVADFIEIFDDSPKFEDVFVSAISNGSAQEGGQILTFPMTFNYLKNAALEQISPTGEGVVRGGVTR